MKGSLAHVASSGKTCTKRLSGCLSQLGKIKMAKTDFERGDGEEEGLEELSIMPEVLNVRVKCLVHVLLFGGFMGPPPEVGSHWRM